MTLNLILPPTLEEKIKHYLIYNNISTTNYKLLSDKIMKASDYYIKNQNSPTPWEKDYMLNSQILYFLPLNFLKVSGAIQRGLEVNFFDNKIEHIIDFGSGLGAATLALIYNLKNNKIKKISFIEKNNLATKIHKNFFTPEIFLNQNFCNHNFSNHKIICEWHTTVKANLLSKNFSKSNLGIFSFSLTELNKIPSWIYKLDNLIIIEPSTKKQGRNLLQIREELSKHKFNIWAPCVHQHTCPLLKYSKKDWCHDRVFWEKSFWYKNIENKMPIKNDNITYSYLLAKKEPHYKTDNKNNILTRIIGDPLKEKGKTKQLICKNEAREFISYLQKKHKNFSKKNREICCSYYPCCSCYPYYHRGDLINLPSNYIKKGNELRL